MSTTHEQPAAQESDTTFAPAQRRRGEGPQATQESPFGIPTPRDDDGFEPTIIRGRE